ncbi:MAG: ABC transporter ATP-binding protein, partial [Verrucomicrobiota bacterium]|nr:ABC transporter ATP-binding protein [Verrucomicrobiota bacterium]
SMIFQEPMTAFSPVHTINNQISEMLILHKGLTKDEAKTETIELLKRVGIPDPGERVDDYTFQYSGGMRQRAMIAMGIACSPRILIADEPTTALDVTIQAQILQLINDLQRDLNMAVILITHDLGVIAETCDEVCVMYAGRIVERASVKEVFANPRHAYTQGLLNSIPRLNGNPKTELNTIEGMVPALRDLKPGCRFAPRSGREHEPELFTERQPMEEISSDHWVEACPVCAKI